MANDIIQMWFFLSLLIQSVLIAVLVREYYLKRVKLLLLLILAFFLSIPGHLPRILMENGDPQAFRAFLFTPLFLSVIVSAFLFYLFFTLFQNPTPNTNELISYSVGLGFILASMLLLPFMFSSGINFGVLTSDALPLSSRSISYVNGILFLVLLPLNVFVFTLLIPFRIIMIIRRIQSSLEVSKHTQEYNFILIGFILFFSAGITEGILLLLGLEENVLVIVNILQLFGQMLIIYTFIASKSFIFSAHRIDNLLLVNDAGLVLFNHEFSGSRTKLNESLIGGILTALNQSMKEVIGNPKEVENIQFGALYIQFRSIEQNHLLLLITERSSRFINQVFSQFVNEFVNEYREKLVSTGIINTKHFKGIEALVEKFFAIKGFHRQLSAQKRLQQQQLSS